VETQCYNLEYQLVGVSLINIRNPEVDFLVFRSPVKSALTYIFNFIPFSILIPLFFVYLRYLKNFKTFIQSSKLRSVDFLEALLITNRISRRIQIAKYSKLPIALRYFVSLNYLVRRFGFTKGIRFFNGVKLLILNLFNMSFMYLP